MPTYDYDCMTCRTTVESVHPMSGRPKVQCKECGNIRHKRVYGILPWAVEINPSPQLVAPLKLEETTSGNHSVSPSNNRTRISATVASQDKDKAEHKMALDKTNPIESNTSLIADDIDPDKLLVEIVQGLLMAHARLDHMEQALCQAIESASLKHLRSFDRNLSAVDLRFQQTTVDARQAVEALKGVQNDLVNSVQQVSIEHYDVFKSNVASMHLNIDHLRTEGVANIAADIKSHQFVEQKHFDELLNSFKYLISNDTAYKENWKNLYQRLNDLRTASTTSATDLKQHIREETKSLSRQISAVSELIDTSDANHKADLKWVRVLLYWLLFLSAALFGRFAASTHNLWMAILLFALFAVSTRDLWMPIFRNLWILILRR